MRSSQCFRSRANILDLSLIATAIAFVIEWHVHECSWFRKIPCEKRVTSCETVTVHDFDGYHNLDLRLTDLGFIGGIEVRNLALQMNRHAVTIICIIYFKPHLLLCDISPLLGFTYHDHKHSDLLAFTSQFWRNHSRSQVLDVSLMTSDLWVTGRIAECSFAWATWYSSCGR